LKVSNFQIFFKSKEISSEIAGNRQRKFFKGKRRKSKEIAGNFRKFVAKCAIFNGNFVGRFSRKFRRKLPNSVSGGKAQFFYAGFKSKKQIPKQPPRQKQKNAKIRRRK
jgi:hypothetical protein